MQLLFQVVFRYVKIIFLGFFFGILISKCVLTGMWQVEIQFLTDWWRSGGGVDLFHIFVIIYFPEYIFPDIE